MIKYAARNPQIKGLYIDLDKSKLASKRKFKELTREDFTSNLFVPQAAVPAQDEVFVSLVASNEEHKPPEQKKLEDLDQFIDFVNQENQQSQSKVVADEKSNLNKSIMKPTNIEVLLLEQEEQTKRPPEDNDYLQQNAASYHQSILDHSDSQTPLLMTITIRNEAKDTTFELSVTNEPIMNLKMKIEESQGMEFAKQ